MKFYFEDDYAGAKAQASVTTRGEHIESVVSAFKVFLAVAGYHSDTIERITLAGDEQGFTQRGDGNPDQGDLFDRRPGDFFDDGEESGV